MSEAAIPADEAQRLAALAALDVLDSEPEEEFDALVRAASLACGVPISLISLVDSERQWFKANVGLPGTTETPRDIAFCAHAILEDGLFEVPDTTQDARFAGNPLVLGEPGIRFYGGVPLKLRDGSRVGTLCVIDSSPKNLDAAQREILHCLARAATQVLEQRRCARLQRQAEANLRKSEEFLDRTGRIAGVGGWELDLRTNELYWSDETCRIYGVAPGHHPTLDEAISFYAPEAQAAIAAAVERATRTGESWDLELPFVSAQGAQLWVRAAGSVDFEDGRPVRLAGAFQDITQIVSARAALHEAKNRMTIATDSGGIGIYEWDLGSGELLWDVWMYRLFGVDPEDAAPNAEQWRTIVHPQDIEAVEQAARDSVESGSPFKAEFRVIWPDGSVHYLRSSGHATRDTSGCAARFVGATWDITEARRLAADLAEQHELMRVTLNSIGDAVITTDRRGDVVWLNPVAERMTGWPMESAAGQPVSTVFRIIDEATREPAQQPVHACMTQGANLAFAAETVLVSRSGEEFGIEDSAAPIRNDGGDILGAVLVFHDVTEQRRLSGEMNYRATHDALTDLVNRAEFETRLARLLAQSHKDATLHAMLYIDLDQFKLVNDACGHAAGDEVLQQVAQVLADTVRAGDTLARLGGDEFAVILEHCSADQAQRVAQQICTRMDHFRYTQGNRRFRVGASIGLVPVDCRWRAIEAIYGAADAACYAAKEAGRNRVHTWFDSDTAIKSRQGAMQWTARIEEALDADRFVLFAQRIVELRQPGEMVHAEVLLRMIDSDGSLILPGAFLPAAERFQLAPRLDRWVVSKTIEWMKRIPELAAIGTISINLSGQSVSDRTFHDWAIDVLRAAGPAVCGRLCFEITETAAVTSLIEASAFIDQVRRLNVLVALDDFGSGASSFGYLKTLRVDTLKIDGQFITHLVDDALSDVTVRCFHEVATVVGVKTVAEFVERPDVLERVRAIGIDFAQGFLLHRPAPIDELLEQHMTLDALLAAGSP